ncbi:MAG: hypothetical protein GX992_02895 [Clostridium sp.]|nr:hypothetical protein [Clostridium sp.]
MKKGTDIGEAIKINEDGYVWIVDGQVFVKNQIGSGMPPLINPHGEVRLIINGMEVNHIVMASENDNIELEALDEERGLEVLVEVCTRAWK